ncbi:FluG family protein [Aspergillus clavatus NRRL 1]|uniref:Glutamine synthetase n=1 Tax=Aspergillus clavatus (strain ATCC 1007 / CBS 513.65 / DSM 816 / NCTC 3887 / NRRL 1 / QM 1276 / 107) TaxID=344612 RepID=A1C7M7_ASPCL|nr:FluG family protein [Aspergillus clavatus NRRL 1]EAW14398.1 FluG family protein [Aspergillus clavatus NRRL 1]
MTVAQSISLWNDFAAKNGDLEFVWLQFMSYRSLVYTRIFPIAKFKSMVGNGRFIAIPKVAFHVGPGDVIAEGVPPSGKFWLQPDFETVYCQPGSKGSRAVIMCDCVNDEGVPIGDCARSRLQELEKILMAELGFSALVGFEVEVVFMRAKKENGGTQYAMTNYEHSWSSMTTEDESLVGMLEAISRTLATVDVPLEQFHAEAAPGQWEFVLPPARPARAVDTLIKARDVIKRVAGSFGYHATLYSRPSPAHAGSGAHVHVSINPIQQEAREGLKRAESFFAGIMTHMPAVLAFSLPMDISYSRVAAGLWSGGEYACWGWENKEVPLRRIEGNRFEFKLSDGFANPYLVLSAMFAAGIEGMRNRAPLRGGDCTKSASKLSANERRTLGIDTVLPKSLDESLSALTQDLDLRKLCGAELIDAYLSVKRTETGLLRQMNEEDRKNWLIARY